MASLKQVADDVRYIREEHIDKIPQHFSPKAIVASMFGALIFGLTFSLKGLLLQVTQNFDANQKWYIVVAILLILTAEIYFIGYARVKDKNTRKFGQFLLKRTITYFGIGFLSAIFLVYVYGVQNLVVSDAHLLNTIVALALPCCIGASIADLLKQY